jgi:uncharacterized protein YggE
VTDQHITVGGVGEASAAPDIAVVTIGIEVTQKSVASARQGAAAAASGVLKALTGGGVAERDIRTSGLRLQPQYDYSRGSSPKVVGYQASHQFTVKVRAIDTVSAVVDGAVLAGGDAARLQGVSFEIDEPAALLAEARRNAVADARLRAGTYAEAAGVGVGNVLSISELPTNESPVRPMMMARAEAMQMEETPIQAGETTISAQVVVRFAIAETAG